MCVMRLSILADYYYYLHYKKDLKNSLLSYHFTVTVHAF